MINIIFDIIEAIIHIALFGVFTGLSVEMFIYKKYIMGGFLSGIAIYEIVRIIICAMFLGR